jgi:hypothetical protein
VVGQLQFHRLPTSQLSGRGEQTNAYFHVTINSSPGVVISEARSGISP